MGIITFILAVLAISIFISLRFKKVIEKTIFVSACLYVLVVYLIGLLNLYSILNVFTYLLILAGAIYFIVEYKKDKESVKNLILRVVLIYIFLIGLLCSLVTINSYVHLWDEFSHWATCVKNMYIFDTLRSDAFTDLIAYPPFVSVLQFACMKLSYTYSEPILYSSLLVFSSMAFCPIINHDKLKGKYIKTALYMILVFVIPFVFFTDYFSTIYVDAILGIILALIVYQIIINEFTRFHFFTISIYTSVLLLVKEFAIIMIGSVFIVLLIDMLIIRRNTYISFFKKTITKPLRLIEFLGFVITPLVMFFSWRIYITQFAISYENISKVTFKLPEYAKDLIDMFVSTATVNGIGVGSGILFWPTYYYIIFFGLIAFACIYKAKKKYRSQLELLCTAIIVTGGIYVFGILISYMFLFGYEEAMQLASFGRYMLTILLATFLMLYMTILDFDLYNRFLGKSPMIIVISLSIISIGIVPFYNTLNSMVYGQRDKEAFYDKYYKELNTVIEKVPSDAKVFYICNDTSGFNYWSSKYYLTPIRIQNNYEDGVDIQYTEGETDINLIKEMIGQYDYVYLDIINQNFIDNFSFLFQTKEEIKDKTLFKVQLLENNISLIKI